MTSPLQRSLLCGCALTVALTLTGCDRKGRFQAISMWNESRLKPMEASPIPGQASSAQPILPATVPRGMDRTDTALYEGRSGGALVTKVPYPVTKEFLLRGQERYNIYCSPCHSRLGDGNGMVAQRGFPHPPDYGLVRLKQSAVGHFYDVMTNGYGAMYSYASRIEPKDRWAIAAYIRVLQQSRPTVTVDKWAKEHSPPGQGLHGPNAPTGANDMTPSNGGAVMPENTGANGSILPGGGSGVMERPSGANNTMGQPGVNGGGTERPGTMMAPSRSTGGGPNSPLPPRSATPPGPGEARVRR